MKKSEIIHIMKDPIQRLMDRLGKGKLHPTFPSRTIAYVLYLYDKKIINDTLIKDNNNPFGLQDPSTADFLSFNTLDECLLEYINNKPANETHTEFDDKYDGIAKAYNLYRFDKQILENKEGNIIDIPEEKRTPKIDLYTIKDDKGNIVGTASTKADADELAKNVKKATITNSRNKIINGTRVVAGTTNMITTAIIPGSKIICDGMNLYYKAKDNRPGRVIDGEYYIYDGKPVNGRYAICMKPEFAATTPSTIIGWINIKDIKK